MQAIETTYHGPTDTTDARIIARCDAKWIRVPWDHALGIEANHRAAAEELARRLGWDRAKYYGRMVSGSLPGAGYCHVFTGKD